MAVLSAGERLGVRAAFSSDLSEARTPFNLSKPDLQAAVNAIDQWVDDNAASFNSAIPQPARGTLTSQQKARLLFMIVRRRFEIS